ncbi:MAG: phosphonate ABC transporter substrate-binding protein [Kiloniellales bacterium]
MLRKLMASAAVASIVAAGPAAAEEMTELNFGIISTESSQALQASFGPFLEDMSEALGVEVKPFFASDYAGVIEAMRFDKVDVAWFGNKSAMEAVDRAGGEVFAQTIKDDGTEGYYSLLLAHVDSPINSLEDVLVCDGTLDFGIGDPNSTSGFLVPSYYVFALNDVDPRECFDTVRNANHETNAMAVANGQVDVATNNTESLYARLAKSQPEAAAQIKEIWRSPLIPSDPMVWRANLSDEVKQKIYFFFMSYGRFGDMEKVEREREVLTNLSDGWGPFLASSNAQLIPIRQLELFRNKVRIENDETMSAEARAQEIAEIDAQLAELGEWEQVVAPRPAE